MFVDQLQDEERRRKQQLEEIRKREAEEQAKQQLEEERRWREEERVRREAEEKVGVTRSLAPDCRRLLHDSDTFTRSPLFSPLT